MNMTCEFVARFTESEAASPTVCASAGADLGVLDGILGRATPALVNQTLPAAIGARLPEAYFSTRTFSIVTRAPPVIISSRIATSF